jgi:predicted short-subunit dehydrogenase-like oxidoreductase (DUF2520 family)
MAAGAASRYPAGQDSILREGYHTTMRIVIVGQGRVGTTVAERLRDRDHQVTLTRQPARDGVEIRSAGCVLLAVPDDRVAECAAELAGAPWLGTFSGATPLAALRSERAFVLHPVQTITREGGPDQLVGAAGCVTATEPAAAELATWLARELGLRPVAVPEELRPLPHVAAVLASNYLAAPLAASARVLAACGLDASLVAPLARRALEHALAAGAAATPTGPIARGDAGTVERHLEALRERAPDAEALYRTLGIATLPLVEPAAAARVAPLLRGEAA